MLVPGTKGCKPASDGRDIECASGVPAAAPLLYPEFQAKTFARKPTAPPSSSNELGLAFPYGPSAHALIPDLGQSESAVVLVDGGQELLLSNSSEQRHLTHPYVGVYPDLCHGLH